MKLDEAIKQMREGKKAKRTDWGYNKSAYLTMEQFYGVWDFFLNKKYCDATMKDKIGYGLTYTDLESENWVIVD